MANIVLQDLTAMIQGTSRRNGNQFDMVHVEILLQTDVPLTPEQAWFIPAGTSVPNEVLEFFKATNISMYPMSEATVLAGTEDIRQQAEQGNLTDVVQDASKLMLRAIMKKTSFTPVTGTNDLYTLSYDYKLFPLKEIPNAYDFKVVLPFDSLGMPSGSKVQMTVITPINSILDNNITRGTDTNGNEIVEAVSPIGKTGRSIVSFEYQVTDPLFTIRYTY